jgi:beta-N-acetylhexosaminidase
MKRRYELLILAAAVLVSAALITACSPTTPSETPGITGTVVSLMPGDGRPASIMVEGGKQPVGAVSDKASVTISPSTQIIDSGGAKAEASAIAKGASVKVWFEGPVAESYPVQGTARVVQFMATP